MDIIWATDGSAASEAALPYLRGPLNQRGNRITVVTAAPEPVLFEGRPDPAMLLWNLVPDYRERVSAAVTDLTVREVGALAGLRAEVTSTILLGSPPVALLNHLNAEPPDLLVMGAHGHSAVRELLVGSVTRQVAVNAPCSVLVVRGRRRPRNVLLAYDGSPDADAAVDLLASLPARGLSVTVLSVLESSALPPAPPDSRETIEGMQVRARAAARASAAGAARRLSEAGWSTATRAREGHRNEEILGAAEEVGADLIALGAGGSRAPAFRAHRASGLAQEVMDHAGMAVLLARAR